MHQQRAMRVNFLPAESQFELRMALISRSVAASCMLGTIGRVLTAETAIYSGTLARSPRLCRTARA